MSESDSRKGKGKAFFDRADQVAETGNWDFAIEMYVEGIKREPENIERGHDRLREVSLKRKMQGGKGPGLRDRMSHRPTKDPTESLANAEFLLAKDPGNQELMVALVQAARKTEIREIIQWSCDLLLEEQKLAKKRNLRVLQLLTDAFEGIEDYRSAVVACQWAFELKPGDDSLGERVQDLGAKYTIQKAGYGDESRSFTEGVKNMDKQRELAQEDAAVKDKTYLEEKIDAARSAYIENPTVAGKVNALVDALLKTDDESYENEAIDVLLKAFQDTKSYQFKMRVGDIKVKQHKRRARAFLQKGDKASATEELRALLAFELEEYAERAINYPTDLGIKYELGRRQLAVGKLDEAIGNLQQARRDPRRHVQAMTALADAFSKKGWLNEAAETLTKTLESEMPEERQKEVRYSLGDVLEKQEKHAEAEEQFSVVAQMDYNYKDVRERLDALRKKKNEG